MRGVSLVRTVSVGHDSGEVAEIVAETEPLEEWEDEDVTQTQTQQEVWLDGEEISGRGIGGDLDAEVEQT